MSSVAQNQEALFSQKEMGQIVNPSARLVFQALSDEKWDFRTVDGIAKETGLSAGEAKRILESYPEFIRRSPIKDRQGRSLYTLKTRTMKGAEKAAFLRLLLTKTR